jgi:TPR repeat protein
MSSHQNSVSGADANLCPICYEKPDDYDQAMLCFHCVNFCACGDCAPKLEQHALDELKRQRAAGAVDLKHGALCCPHCRASLWCVSNEESFAQGLKLLREKPEGRHVSHLQYFLAERYRRGIGVTQDETRAFTLTHSAAEKGHPIAQFSTALHYSHGICVDPCPKTAFEWAMKAAVQDLPDAQSMVGSFYARGEHVEEDPETASCWIARAAKNGAIRGMCNLGIFYFGGYGVEQSHQEAAKWLMKALKMGFEGARGPLKKSLLAIQRKQQVLACIKKEIV